MNRGLLGLLFCLLGLASCATRNDLSQAQLERARERLPAAPRHREGFYECSRCGTLRGSYSRIGWSSSRVVTPTAKFCLHRWVRIRSKREFMRRVELCWPGTLERERNTLPRDHFWDLPEDKI